MHGDLEAHFLGNFAGKRRQAGCLGTEIVQCVQTYQVCWPGNHIFLIFCFLVKCRDANFLMKHPPPPSLILLLPAS